MNAERLLELYDNISEAPGAVERLRRFVLDLAVRGKLVEQDAGDEPASELLKRIDLEKDRLKKAGEIKNRTIRARERTEPPLVDLPKGWALTDLGTVAFKITDGAHKTPSYVEAGIPFVSVKDFSAGALDLSNTRFIPEAEHHALFQRCDPRRGDILLGRIGTLGKAVLIETDVEFSLFVSVGLIRFDHDNLVPEFFCRLLNSPFVEAEFDRIKVGGGTHTNKLNLGDLHTVALLLPPLAEQHRIVSKVDELMALCDRLEEARKEREETRDRLTTASLARLTAPDTKQALSGKVETGFPSDDAQTDDSDFPAHAAFALNALPALTARPHQIKSLRQTILNLAVRGKLAEQDPADEPASELLSNIEKNRSALLKSKQLKKSQATKNPISFRNEYHVPNGWSFATCDELFFVTKLAGFEYTKYFNLQDVGEVPVIRAQNVRPMQVSKDNLKYITEAVSDALPRSSLTKDCLLVTFIGAGIGDVALFKPKRKWHLAPNVAKVEPFQGAEEYYNLRFLVLFFNSPLGRKEVFKHVKITAQPSLSMNTIRDIDVLMPPLAEQHRIVAKVDELMALCDQLEAALTKTDTTRTRLLEALLHEALEPSLINKDAVE